MKRTNVIVCLAVPLLAQTAQQAQEMAKVATGELGWVGLAIQAGCFGLVAIIVVYLYPKMSRDARDDQAKREELWRSFFKEMKNDFNERNDKIADEFNKQTVALTRSFESASTKIETALTNVCRGRIFATREGDKQA